MWCVKEVRLPYGTVLFHERRLSRILSPHRYIIVGSLCWGGYVAGGLAATKVRPSTNNVKSVKIRY